MILVSTRKKVADWPYKPESLNYTRWALEVAPWWSMKGNTVTDSLWGFLISWQREVHYDGSGWREAGPYFTADVTRRFALGTRHDYYDGPHCGVDLGFLHLSWSYGWCKKCCRDQ